MDYWQMVRALSEQKIDTYNFKDFVKFRNRTTSVEVDVSRNEMPRKHATNEQCEKVYDFVVSTLLHQSSAAL